MSRYIGINTKNMTAQQCNNFIESCAKLIFSGPGSISRLSKALPIKESDGLKVLLGVPDGSITLEQQRIFEAVYGLVMGQPINKNVSIWTSDGFWSPANPRFVPNVPLADSVPDVEFFESIPLRKAVMEEEVLLGMSFSSLNKPSQYPAASNLRLYSALAMYGFDEPGQFFIPAALKP